VQALLTSRHLYQVSTDGDTVSTRARFQSSGSCLEVKRAAAREGVRVRSGPFMITTRSLRATVGGKHPRLAPVLVWCDMVTDGGGYTVLPVSGGLVTSRFGQADSCARVGMRLLVPRTQGHFAAVLRKYGRRFLRVVPGVFKQAAAPNADPARRAEQASVDVRAVGLGSVAIGAAVAAAAAKLAARAGGVPPAPPIEVGGGPPRARGRTFDGWRAVGGVPGPWFVSGGGGQAPGSGCAAGCWLPMTGWTPDAPRFVDARYAGDDADEGADAGTGTDVGGDGGPQCSAASYTDAYLCSTNDKTGEESAGEPVPSAAAEAGIANAAAAAALQEPQPAEAGRFTVTYTLLRSSAHAHARGGKDARGSDQQEREREQAAAPWQCPGPAVTRTVVVEEKP
jgi:hypothetical protein